MRVFVFRKMIVFFVFACFAVFDKCHPMYPLSLGNIAGRSFHETTKECASMQRNNVYMFTILALSTETQNVFEGLFAEQFKHLSDEEKNKHPESFKNTYPHILINEYSLFLDTKIKNQTNRTLSEIILDDDFELLSESEIKDPNLYRKDLLQQHIFAEMAKSSTKINEHNSLEMCALNIATAILTNFSCKCLNNEQQPQRECEISCKFYKLMIYKRWLYYMMALMAKAEYNDVYFLPENIEWNKPEGTYVLKEGVDQSKFTFIGYDGVIEAFNKLINMNIPHGLEP